MRNLKEELLNINGINFPQWYQSLTKLEKLEYTKIMKDLGKNVLSDK
tara:strand:+ start:1701 stop:1841 length:141 start_codon:yes stop_codon:yes gene_type:complete